MKNTNQAAGNYFLIRRAADIMETDPEIVDEYMFRFAQKWGKDIFHNLINFLLYTQKFDIPNDIAKKTLEMDFSYDGDDPSKLAVPEYTDSKVGGLQ